MAISDRELIVWSNSTKVGRLLEHNNLWRFEYDAEWTLFDLAPALPRASGSIEDGGTNRPVQWFFDNLLPEEGARTLLAKDARVDRADAFGLLAHFGAESAGALTLLSPEETPQDGGKTPLSFETLSERIRALPDVALSQGGSKRMSLAGAQHKLPVIYENGSLYEPDQSTPSTHILKPNHSKPDTYPHTVINEYVMMRLASAVGLQVPDVHIIRVQEPAYLIERFDRVYADGVATRTHVIDACQLLSYDRAYKYDQCLPDALTSIIDTCRSKAVTRQRLFCWFLFNLLIGNTDNHLKNLSFTMTRDGVELAPHYDLVSTAIYEPNNGWLQADLEWKIGSVTKLGGVNVDYLAELGEVLGVTDRYRTSTTRAYLARIKDGFERIYKEVESQTYPDNLQKAGELQHLRHIQHGVVADMRRLLGAED